MADHGIFNEAEKYCIIRQFWINNNMSAYLQCTEQNNRNFRSLRRYLMEKDGVLPRVFITKNAFVQWPRHNIEVRQWLADFEDKEMLHIFLFFLHLIPKYLKNKISSSLSLGFEEFRRYVMLTCDLDMIKTKGRTRQLSQEPKPTVLSRKK